MSAPKSTGGEPVLAATVLAAAAALIALLVAFNVDLTDDQQAAILGVVTVAAPIIAGFVARSRVTPNEAVSAVVTDGGLVAGEGASTETGDPVWVRPALEVFPLADPPVTSLTDPRPL